MGCSVSKVGIQPITSEKSATEMDAAPVATSFYNNNAAEEFNVHQPYDPSNKYNNVSNVNNGDECPLSE